MSKTVLQVNDLHTEFRMRHSTVYAVNGVSYEVHAGEIIGIVGESGCGKSVTQMSTLNLIPSPPGKISQGEVIYDGKNLIGKETTKAEMRDIRGNRIAMIFQEPMTSLNPLMRVGDQIAEAILQHKKVSKKEARQRAIELMKMVKIPDAEQRYSCYPNEFSGGMCQRGVIAMAMSCEPELLIADEATTALDVTIQAQILEMLRDIVRQTQVGLLIVTHNLGIVARYADRIYVMYAGRVVESGPASEIFRNPSHAYTIGLLNSVPRLDDAKDRQLMPIEGFPPSLSSPPVGCSFAPRCTQQCEACSAENMELREVSPGHFTRCCNTALDRSPKTGNRVLEAAKLSGEPLLEIEHVSKRFTIRGGLLGRKTVGYVHALSDVNLTIRKGETLGLVGESGCGKTTLARTILNLHQPSDGQVRWRGKVIAEMSKREQQAIRKDIQMIFQDPFASLDPRMTIGDIIGEPLKVHHMTKTKKEYDQRVNELFKMAGLDPALRQRSPHELSGGQRQRVGIARALASEPKLLVCDEPVSALDVSVQAQILNLLEELQRTLGVAYLFIAHDLSVVRHISDNVAVMYLGRVVEYGDWKSLYEHPAHPYTRTLLSAVPIPDPEIEEKRNIEVIRGDVPSVSHIPEGCSFHTRCPYATEECKKAVPQLRELADGHHSACIYAEKLLAEPSAATL